MKLKERVTRIGELQNSVTTPWEIMRVFGKIELHGDQLCFGQDHDFVSIKDARIAIQMLASELGGRVTWEKDK